MVLTGNGMTTKCADELGHIAATMTRGMKHYRRIYTGRILKLKFGNYIVIIE